MHTPGLETGWAREPGIVMLGGIAGIARGNP